MNNSQNDNQIDAFEGSLLHPSLDIKAGILVLGFRYRSKANEEKYFSVVVNHSNIEIVYEENFTLNDKTYYLEKRNRKLARIEEKWSISALQQFLKDEAQFKQVINPHDVFDNVVTLAKRYMELDQETDYYLLAAWIIGSYFCPIFSAYPFLHIKAPKRSGKSQCLNFLTQLCFNAIKARPSLPALSDTVDALRGTYLIDQADGLWRKGSEDLLDILADSYKKSGGKRRVVNFDKNRGRETLEFETYSPKALASIKELPEDLRDRCLVVQLIRSKKNFPDPDDNNENWKEVRGKLYMFLMTNYIAVESSYTVKKIEYRRTQEILGRSLELWLPFEVILESMGLQDKIKEAKARFLSQYDFSEYEPSELEEEVIKTILIQFQDQAEIILTPKEISELVNSDIFSPNDTPKQNAAKVGWAIKKFNLASEKLARTGEGMRYRFQKDKVESVNQSYCKTTDEHTPPTPVASQGDIINQLVV